MRRPAAIETHYMTTANLLVEVTALRDEQPG
jgi:hypothetical protein